MSDGLIAALVLAVGAGLATHFVYVDEDRAKLAAATKRARQVGGRIRGVAAAVLGMKSDARTRTLLLVLTVLFATFVWPTPYYYVTGTYGRGWQTTARINRFTGSVDYLVNGSWQRWN